MAPFLIFDAYGTLVELDDFYNRLQSGFAQHGLMLPREVVKRAAHREMTHYMAHAMRARDHASWAALRHECAAVLAGSLREQGHAPGMTNEAIAHVLFDALVFRAFPDVRPALEELRRRDVPLGVLSNWDFQLPAVLREVGLGKFFQFVLTSAEAGAQKPAPEFFAQGVRCAQNSRPGLTARECFYIGDHYEKDVLGARAAGLAPLWLLRERRDLASGDIHEASDEVLRLASLSDLPALLSRL